MDDSSDGRPTREGSSMDQELCLVWLYCVIDGALRSMIGTGRLRTRGPEPELTDAEILTLQIWGEMRGLASDATIWRDAAAKLREWFPRLGAEWNFVRRCGNLAGVQERLLTRLRSEERRVGKECRSRGPPDH